MEGPGGRRATSQTLKALLALRELVIRGELRPGDRVSELQMVERLGVSRTPLRTALVRLEEEGLLEAIPTGGHAVKSFSARDVNEAIEIRGTLEGLAARLAAERGAAPAALAEAGQVVEALDRVVSVPPAEFDMDTYVALNARFHALLHEMAAAPALSRLIERANALPFASPSAMVPVQANLPGGHHIFLVAQDQHRAVLAAIVAREGSRAEAVMREHARIARRNLALALETDGHFDRVPGSSLIDRGEG
jgi:GntR family transcriptional regulator of vanillate catabolism